MKREKEKMREKRCKRKDGKRERRGGVSEKNDERMIDIEKEKGTNIYFLLSVVTGMPDFMLMYLYDIA